MTISCSEASLIVLFFLFVLKLLICFFFCLDIHHVAFATLICIFMRFIDGSKFDISSEISSNVIDMHRQIKYYEHDFNFKKIIDNENKTFKICLE